MILFHSIHPKTQAENLSFVVTLFFSVSHLFGPQLHKVHIETLTAAKMRKKQKY